MTTIGFETLIVSVKGADVDFSRGIVKLRVPTNASFLEATQILNKGMEDWDESMKFLLTINEDDQDYISWTTRAIRANEESNFDPHPFDVTYMFGWEQDGEIDPSDLVLYGMQVYDE